MTPKQKLRSIEKKMESLESRNLSIDIKLASRHFLDIERYHKLEREHFFLKFEIEHCEKCGKKL
jgi:hypothetical protein